MQWIRPLDDLTVADQAAVGSKAANLGAMAQAGFNVPAGFVITVDAFVDHFGQNTDPLVKPRVPRISAELMAEVVQALMEMLGDQEFLAVRSSSTEEDAQDASFAGMHSTYYFVTPHRLDEAIVDCWMSMWSPAAVQYKRTQWQDLVPGQPARMAVIIQRMLPADSAGVLFTRHPTQLNDIHSHIEACWGLGAALVDGRVSPDRAVLDEQGRLTSYSTGHKQHQVKISQSNHSGSRLQELAPKKQHARVLTPEQCTELADLGHQLEHLFEAPQDIEWAYVDQTLYLLQSRPITTRIEYPQVTEPLVLFKPLIENFTEPLTPMSQDLYAQVMPKVGAFYLGRLYVNFKPLHWLNPFNMHESETAEALLFRPPAQDYPLKPLKALRLATLLAGSFVADGINWLRTSWLAPDDLLFFDKRAKRIAEQPNIGALTALRSLIWGRTPFEPMAGQMLYCNVSAGRYFLLIGLLNKLVRRWAPDFDQHLLSRIYHRRDDMASLRMVDAFADLADLLKTTLADMPPPGATQNQAHPLLQLQAALEGRTHALPSNLAFTHAFEAFLQEYGHRGPREMEMASPRWRDAPAQLLRQLASHGGQLSDRDPYGSHLAARDQLHQQLSPWRQRCVDYLGGKIARYIKLREDTRQHHIRAFAVTRQKLLELEQALLEKRRLRIAGDIFFLNFAEATALQSGTLTAEAAQLTIRQRRRQWLALARERAPDTINIHSSDRAADPAEDNLTSGDTALSGYPASPGRVTGRVRVALTLASAQELETGEVLVAPYTDPAWTPLFSKAAAIVVDTGSFLSHAGTVARELQIPCLVDVRHCTDRLKSGDLIEVDADAGHIQVLTGESAGTGHSEAAHA